MQAILVLSFGLVANLLPLMTFAATMPQIAAEWGLSAGEAGWIGGIYFAGYAAAVPFLAGATDRIDGRWLYIGSAALGAVATFAFAFSAESFPTALVLRLIGGIAVAGVHMPGLKLLVDRTSDALKGRAAAIYTSSYAAGNSVSFLVAGIVEAAFGWRAAFVAAGIGPLLAIAALSLLPSAPPMRNASKRPLFELSPLLRNRALMAYVIAFAGNTWEVFAVRVWFVACLSWTLSLPGNSLPLPALGVIAGIASLAGVPASIAVAEFALRYGRQRMIVATCFVSVCVCLALAATAGGPIVVVLSLLVLVQITSFADVGALGGGAIAAADPERRGAALALYALTGFASGFAGPVVVGGVLDWFGGSRSVAGWEAAFGVMAAGSAAAAFALRHAPD
jgi:MFS family permease